MRSSLLLSVCALAIAAGAARAETAADPAASAADAAAPEAAAPADQGADQSSTAVKEVVVTANPLGVTQKALTANVDVLDQKQLSTAPAVGLGDLVAGLPGVRSSNFAPGASRPVIRGLSGARVQVLTNGLGMIDASTLSEDHQVAVDPSEAEKVEVVRGPATLAYGGSAIGGVVNIVDGRIPETPATGLADGRVGAQVSSVDDGWSVSGQAKTGEGPWVFAAQGTKRETNDYDIPGPAMSKRLADFLGVPRTGPDKVVNSWSELEEYGVGGSYVTGVGYAGMSFKRTDSEYGTVAEEDVHIKLKQNRVDGRGELDYDLGPFAKIRAAAGYADYQHTEFEGSEPGTIFASTGWEGRVELVQRKRGGWQGSVGVQALQRDISAIGDEAVLPSTEVKEAGIFTVQRVDHGAFGLEAGARVDQRQLSSVVAERRFTDVSASGGVFWRPLTGLYLGLTVAHNERAPSEIELFAFGPHPATGQFLQGNPDFDAEKANSVEGAIHYGHDRLDGDLHLYYAKYDGFIDLRPTGAVDAGTGFPIFDYVQTDADFKGFEADASYKLWVEGERSLSVEGSADLVRAEGDLGPIARIPPWSVTGRLVYASPRWEAHAEVRHVAEQDRVADFELPTDAYTMVNLYGSVKPIEGSDVTLFAEVRNLTDEEAREHASALKDIAPLPGRNLRVGVTYKF